MTTLQRYILIVGLVVAAAIAHFSFCGWSFGGQFGRNVRVVVGWGDYGSYAKADFTFSVIVGVIAPWFLLMAAVYLWAGRKRAARRQRGACLQCGYELQFNYESGCPECGWRRVKSA